MGERGIMYQLCSLNSVTDFFVMLISKPHDFCQLLRTALLSSARLTKTDLFSSLARFFTQCADPQYDTPTHKSNLSKALRDIWKMLNGTRNIDSDYSEVNSLLDRFHFDDVTRPHQIPDMFAVVVEVLRVDDNIRDIIARNFTNTLEIWIFVPSYGKYPVVHRFLDVPCFELLNSFKGLRPKKVVKGSKPKPLQYTISDIVTDAFDGTWERIKLEMYNEYVDEFELDIRAHHIEIGLFKQSAANVITMHWDYTLSRSGNAKKSSREVVCNTPIILKHKVKQIGHMPACNSVFEYRTWVVSSFQEILHTGLLGDGHLYSRRASTDPNRITCTDADSVQNVGLYTVSKDPNRPTRAERMRKQIGAICVFSTELPAPARGFNVESYCFRTQELFFSMVKGQVNYTSVKGTRTQSHTVANSKPREDKSPRVGSVLPC